MSEYNYNTKYGRKKAREQARYKYDTGTPEYRAEIDEIGCWTWTVILVIAAVIGFFIFLAQGSEGLLKWLR